MQLDNLENITENMNYDGYEGKWYSHIHNMEIFRIRYLDDELTVWKVLETGQVLIDDPAVRSILKGIKL